LIEGSRTAAVGATLHKEYVKESDSLLKQLKLFHRKVSAEYAALQADKTYLSGVKKSQKQETMVLLWSTMTSLGNAEDELEPAVAQLSLLARQKTAKTTKTAAYNFKGFLAKVIQDGKVLYKTSYDAGEVFEPDEIALQIARQSDAKYATHVKIVDLETKIFKVYEFGKYAGGKSARVLSRKELAAFKSL
jgi:hypothetical protein